METYFFPSVINRPCAASPSTETCCPEVKIQNLSGDLRHGQSYKIALELGSPQTSAGYTTLVALRSSLRQVLWEPKGRSGGQLSAVRQTSD